MLRIASQRLLVSGRVSAGRSLSTTSPLLVKIRRPDGSTTAAASQPSPAERPSSPPPEPPRKRPSPSTPFEPIVRSNNPDTLVSSSAQPVEPPTVPSTPPPPPEPEAPIKRDLSKLPSLDVDSELARIAEPEDVKSEGQSDRRQRTGAGRKEYVSSIEKQRRLMLRWGIGALIAGGLGAAYFGGEDVPGQESNQSQYERIKANMTDFFDYFNKPAFKVLLPDALPPPHQRPYTLLIDLEGMLVSSSWDRTSGWRTAKRPGVDYFLAYLSQFYEIVLFTSQPLYTAAPVAEKLDPFGAYLPYKLFRESTRSVDGKVVKDISYLNRDPSKVIILDTNPEHVTLQPENGLIIKPWEGKGGDQGLVELIPFLESIAFYNVKDVRPPLQGMQGKDIAEEYSKIEAEQKRVALLDWDRSHPSSVHGAGSSFLSSVFGSVAAPGRTRQTQPMTFIEQKRAEAQRQYQEEQKYWKDHAEEFQKMIEEDKQKQLAEMKGSLWGYFGGAQPKPEGQPGK